MRFKLSFLLLVGVIFIVTQSFQCESKPNKNPGVNIIHVTVVDENNDLVPFAPIGLFKLPNNSFSENECLVDTFHTKADGEVTLSFLNTDKNFFAVQVLPHQLSRSPKFVFDDIGEHETTLHTTHAQSLINIHLNPSSFDSTVIFSNPPEFSGGISCFNSLILVPQYLDRKKITNNSTEHFFTLQGIPNQYNFIKVQNYTGSTIADSTIYVQLDNTSISIEIN